MNRKAIVLLSGGLDSATTLYIAKKEGYKCFCLSFDYGQRHKKELIFAKKIAQRAKAGHKIIKLKLPYQGSSLLDKTKEIPNRKEKAISGSGIPSTYVPARNTIFLSLALSCAEAIGAKAVFIGANAIDYSGYPDCRPEYFSAFSKVIKNGLKNNSVRIFTPLLNETKAGIVRKGFSLGVPFELTWSCYAGGKYACGVCDSCILREKGFKQAGLTDLLIK